MRLNLLIPSYNDSVNDIPANLLPQRSDVRYFVSHQISPDRAGIEMPAELDRPDVIYSSFTGKGVALNRSHCLDMARQAPRGEDEICLMTDDDASYRPDSFDIVMDTFRENPDMRDLCIDGTYIKAHRSSAGAKKGLRDMMIISISESAEGEDRPKSMR